MLEIVALRTKDSGHTTAIISDLCTTEITVTVEAKYDIRTRDRPLHYVLSVDLRNPCRSHIW
jgi:hypothetical protein